MLRQEPLLVLFDGEHWDTSKAVNLRTRVSCVRCNPRTAISVDILNLSTLDLPVLFNLRARNEAWKAYRYPFSRESVLRQWATILVQPRCVAPVRRQWLGHLCQLTPFDFTILRGCLLEILATSVNSDFMYGVKSVFIVVCFAWLFRPGAVIIGLVLDVHIVLFTITCMPLPVAHRTSEQTCG